MKIAVTSTGTTLDHSIWVRFGSSGYLLIIDTDTMNYEAIVDPIIAARGPAADRLFVRILIQEKVQSLLTGGCSPKLIRMLQAAGIEVLIGRTGSVRSAVKQFKEKVHSCSPIRWGLNQVRYLGS